MIMVLVSDLVLFNIREGCVGKVYNFMLGLNFNIFYLLFFLSDFVIQDFFDDDELDVVVVDFDEFE